MYCSSMPISSEEITAPNVDGVNWRNCYYTQLDLQRNRLLRDSSTSLKWSEHARQSSNQEQKTFDLWNIQHSCQDIMMFIRSSFTKYTYNSSFARYNTIPCWPPEIEASGGLNFLSFHRELFAIDCEPKKQHGANIKLEENGNIPMIPVFLLHIIDHVLIDLSCRSTLGKYGRPRETTLFRDQCCKVESGQVSICGEIQVNATYWKFSDSYAFAAVATNLACKAFCSPRV